MAGIQAKRTVWPAGWVDRAPQMADADRVAEMHNARSQRLFGENQATIDDIRRWWTSPRMDLATDMRLVFDASGVVAGLAVASHGGPPYADLNCSAIVHPLYESHAELWDWLQAWALARVAQFVPLASPEIRVAVSTLALRDDPARCAAAERAGFGLARAANHMRIDLATPTPAPEWPSGISPRTAALGRDLEGIVRLFLEAWRDHWGFVDRPFSQTLDEWKEGVDNLGDRLDPTLWFLAVDGPEIVGMSLCDDRIVDDRTRGKIDSLGVRPAWRRRGIALALLRHTFAEFRRRGYKAVELDMDSQNLTGALRVYERAGLQVVRQNLCYERVLRAGVDLATRELTDQIAQHDEAETCAEHTSPMRAAPWPTGWSDRALRVEDADRIAEMMNARSQKLSGENQSTPEEVRTWWTGPEPRIGIENDMRGVFDAAHDVAGIAAAHHEGEPYADLFCDATVHPRYEDRRTLWDWLYSWALRRAAEFVPLASEEIRVAARSGALQTDGPRCTALERAGFEVVRVVNHMAIALAAPPAEASWPRGISVRSFEMDRDLEAIARLNLEAWRDHWGFVPRSFDHALADWKGTIASRGAHFDPTLWFLAVDGAEVVGMSLCDDRIVDDTTRGYIDALGVRPAWRKRGIALALLCHAFAEFRRRGYAAVELDMDSQNLTGALRVYERAGMHVIRRELSYEKELRSGVDLATRALPAAARE